MWYIWAGMFPSEMTDHQGKHLSAEKTDAIGKGITGVPMRRGGTYVSSAACKIILRTNARDLLLVRLILRV